MEGFQGTSGETQLHLSPGSTELQSPFHLTPGQSPLPNEGTSFIFCWRTAAVQQGREDKESQSSFTFIPIDFETSKKHPPRKARALAKGTSQHAAERSRNRMLKSHRLPRPARCPPSLHHLELVQEDGIEQGHPSRCCLYRALCWAPRRRHSSLAERSVSLSPPKGQDLLDMLISGRRDSENSGLNSRRYNNVTDKQ